MNAFEHNANAGNGVVNVTNTSPVTGDFYAVQVVTAATFSAFTERGATGSITTSEVAAGTWFLNGQGITGFTLSAGSVRAYKRLVY